MLKKQILILLSSFALLSSCSTNSDSEMAYYSLSGQVMYDSASTLVPIRNIRVIRQSTDFLLYPDTTKTDKTGKFYFECTDYYSKTKTFKLKVEDIDNVLNGGMFTSTELSVKLSASDWVTNTNPSSFKGMAEKSIQITLTQ